MDKPNKANLDESQIIAKGKSYNEAILSTDNTRLAATLLVFKAALLRNCPLEWVDIHRSRESFLRNLEHPENPDYQPKPKVTFNFYEGSVPGREIVKAFETELDQLQKEFELTYVNLPEGQRREIEGAVSRLIARACHEVLLRREELVRLIKRVPHNSKFDQISSGKILVRLGKNSSPELRSRYLSKLPDE